MKKDRFHVQIFCRGGNVLEKGNCGASQDIEIQSYESVGAETRSTEVSHLDKQPSVPSGTIEFSFQVMRVTTQRSRGHEEKHPEGL